MTRAKILPCGSRGSDDVYPVECFGGPLDGDRLNYFTEGAVAGWPGGAYRVRWTHPHYRYEWQAES